LERHSSRPIFQRSGRPGNRLPKASATNKQAAEKALQPRSQSRVSLNVLTLYASGFALLRALLESFLSSLF
jgi:hypothetical protein